MRLIDADALIAEFPHDEDWDYPVNTNSYVVEAINSAPSIDIVRCGECKHWHKGVCWGIPFSGDDASYIDTESDDFCSYGEARDE